MAKEKRWELLICATPTFARQADERIPYDVKSIECPRRQVNYDTAQEEPCKRRSTAHALEGGNQHTSRPTFACWTRFDANHGAKRAARRRSGLEVVTVRGCICPGSKMELRRTELRIISRRPRATLDRSPGFQGDQVPGNLQASGCNAQKSVSGVDTWSWAPCEPLSSSGRPATWDIGCSMGARTPCRWTD